MKKKLHFDPATWKCNNQNHIFLKKSEEKLYNIPKDY